MNSKAQRSMRENEHEERIRLRDARDIYTLLGECLALGGDGVAWRRHLVTQVRKLCDADLVFFADSRFVGAPESPEGWLRPVSIIDDWECDGNRHLFWKYIQQGRFERSPSVSMLESGNAVTVASRAELVSDDEWYASDFYRENMAPTQLDDFVQAVYVVPDGALRVLAVHRAHGKPPIPRRVVEMIRLIWGELCDWQPERLAGVSDSVFTELPKRMLQVLSCLLVGNTVKETSVVLEISTHTVQEYVKRLYKKAGVSSRAELSACYRDISATLIAMPLDKFPDHRQQIDEATRKPWPAEPGETP